jgi:hypothetical protein
MEMMVPMREAPMVGTSTVLGIGELTNLNLKNTNWMRKLGDRKLVGSREFDASATLDE